MSRGENRSVPNNLQYHIGIAHEACVKRESAPVRISIIHTHSPVLQQRYRRVRTTIEACMMETLPSVLVFNSCPSRHLSHSCGCETRGICIGICILRFERRGSSAKVAGLTTGYISQREYELFEFLHPQHRQKSAT